MWLQIKNGRFEPDAGLENLQKLPENLREPLKEGVNKCRKADEGTVLYHKFRK
jgi:hypothetical protein